MINIEINDWASVIYYITIYNDIEVFHVPTYQFNIPICKRNNVNVILANFGLDYFDNDVIYIKTKELVLLQSEKCDIYACNFNGNRIFSIPTHIVFDKKDEDWDKLATIL